MSKLVLITGCSGGGKSTLLEELGRRGHAVVPEPGRRVVEAELGRGGNALPWVDMAAFLHRATELARADLRSVQERAGWVFFDRGLLDAAVALAHHAGVPIQKTLGGRFPYARTVFLVPPWREIFATDAGRRHGFAEAVAEFDRIGAVLDRLGCDVRLVPKASVAARADGVLRQLG